MRSIGTCARGSLFLLWTCGPSGPAPITLPRSLSPRESCPTGATPASAANAALSVHAAKPDVAKRVGFAERMSAFTRCLAGVRMRQGALAPQDVLAQRHRLKVRRIHAMPNAAEMVNREARWDRSDEKFVGRSMNREVPASPPASADAPVPMCTQMAKP